MKIVKCRLNPKKVRDSDYFTLSAKCKICGVQYSIKRSDPEVSRQPVTLDVTRVDDHDTKKHSQKPTKVRVDRQARIETAKAINSYPHNGSSHDYVNAQAAIAPDKPRPSEDVCRKLSSQFKNGGYNKTINWSDSLISAAKAFVYSDYQVTELFKLKPYTKDRTKTGYVHRVEVKIKIKKNKILLTNN